MLAKGKPPLLATTSGFCRVNLVSVKPTLPPRLSPSVGAAVTAGTVLNLTGDKPSLDPEGSIITIAGDLNASTVSITAAAGQGAKLVSSIDGNQELSNSQLKRTPASSTTVQTIAIIGFTQASLAGGASDNTMSIGGWTGSVTVDGGSGYDTISVTTDTDFNIADGLIKRVGTGDATIIGIENGVFRGGAKANKFDVSGWTKDGQVFEFSGLGGPALGVVAVGFLAALLSGLIAIRFMLGYLRRHGLGIFVAYRLVLAVIVVVSLGLG